MRTVLFLLLALLTTDPKEIAKINKLKKEAAEAFQNGNFELAANRYSTLYDSMGIDEDEIKLNLAHAYYQLNDTSSAKNHYGSLSTSENNQLKSIAYQQLGVMNKNANQLEAALQQLKSSIKADPTNQQARYNYEVVKKQIEEQQQQQQDQQNQDQENQEGEDENQENQDQQGEDNQEQQDKEGEQQESEQDQEKEGEQQEQENQQQEGEEQEQEKSQEQMTKEKLEEMNISEEKAQMILEAMKNNEIQYLQQQKRKATERPPSGKPDW